MRLVDQILVLLPRQREFSKLLSRHLRSHVWHCIHDIPLTRKWNKKRNVPLFWWCFYCYVALLYACTRRISTIVRNARSARSEIFEVIFSGWYMFLFRSITVDFLNRMTSTLLCTTDNPRPGLPQCLGCSNILEWVLSYKLVFSYSYTFKEFLFRRKTILSWDI